MSTTVQDSAITSKTRELCETILRDPTYMGLRNKIETFLANDSAKELYRTLAERGEQLNQKQQQGAQLSPEEIKSYEGDRDKLFGNPIAAGFIEAQQEMQKVQETVGAYISKTLELGRVPSEEDMEGSCGHGCGCHH